MTLTLGAECPPGDVFWVQSVHRAYLDRSPGPTVSGWQAPAWSRRLLPRHRIILAMEHRYFGAHPRAILCTSAQEISDLGTYYGVTADRCRVMPNGFDPTIFNAERRDVERDASRARLGMSSDEMSILFVANELHRKGFGTLIEALAVADVPEARVDVVGQVSPGDYESQDRQAWTDGKDPLARIDQGGLPVLCGRRSLRPPDAVRTVRDRHCRGAGERAAGHHLEACGSLVSGRKSVVAAGS